MLLRTRRPHPPALLLLRPFATTPIAPADLSNLIHRHHHLRSKHHHLLPLLASPPVLALAAANLAARALSPAPTVSPSFISALSHSLLHHRLPPSLLSTLLPSRLKGAPLPLPSLPLKVALESLRTVLAAIYDKRFPTFVYGGRAGMGRHTALRYLRSHALHPSWCFRIAFRRHPFGPRHVDRLAAILSEKIDDAPLVSLVRRLFESGAVRIEVGGVGMGRGLPQESELGGLLLNIYLERVDREIERIRLQVREENPRVPTEGEGGVLNKPVRLYAVRYFDEILVLTSGSKTLAMDVKDRVVGLLEGELELEVDRVGSSVHSAVMEKMCFMGMELQAVTPSVLHPPMSEKAIRAKKKHLKRKEAKKVEVRNARETIRKKLGMKILSHVYKKLKRGAEFKFDFQIESEVREVFRGWADETVAEFFRSREDCWSWHRMLTSGDFLSVKKVRDQLPPELVGAYDKFQEDVNKYLAPAIASNNIEEKERHQEEEDERRYAKRTVEDLTELKMRVNAPMELVKRAVKLAGFTNSMGRPRPIKLLICLDDVDIIKWYAGVGRRWLDFFCCCRNFRTVKMVVNYHLRFSCFLTLAEKHESTKREAIRHYTKDLKTTNGDGMEEVHFPTEREIRMMGDKNLSDPKPVDGALSMILVRLAVGETSHSCLAHFCDRTDTGLFRIRLLQNRLNVDPLKDDRWVPGMGAIHEALNKKCLPLCPKHASDLFLGAITLQDIDCTSFLVVD